MKCSLLALSVLSFGLGHLTYSTQLTAQLLVVNARVLDVRTGTVTPRRTIVVVDGLINRVIGDSLARREGSSRATHSMLATDS